MRRPRTPVVLRDPPAPGLRERRAVLFAPDGRITDSARVSRGVERTEGNVGAVVAGKERLPAEQVRRTGTARAVCAAHPAALVGVEAGRGDRFGPVIGVDRIADGNTIAGLLCHGTCAGVRDLAESRV
ncbi:hypothetical protein [Streptomyces sp. HUAS ZL42]|uniref:hypothetical protein n=1 Tax=Streptomyces sp. HUAS ZL42 TaxID=3231715 RepID=UPI00345E24E9